MSIANLQTLDIFKKAKLRKDAAPSGGAVTTTDLQSGGLLVPEQGGRMKRLQSMGRKMRKPVKLGKSCGEVSKAKDALGHGSEKHGGYDIRTTAPELEAGLKSSGQMPSYGYAKDDDFEKHVLHGIKNRNDALNFAGQLESEHKDGYCQKANQIRDWMRSDTWSGDWARMAVAPARRVHCGVHDPNSFSIARPEVN